MRISKLPEERKKEIVDIARRLFIEQGVSETSISQIAKDVGVAKGLFYYYFKTKSDVLEAVLEEICSEHVNYFEKRLEEQGKDFYCRLLILVDTYYDIYPHFKNEDAKLIHFEPSFAIAFHQKYLARIDHIIDHIIDEGKTLGHFALNHPKLTLIMTLEGVYGLLGLYSLSGDTVTELIEESLKLPQHSFKKTKRDLLLNFE